MYSLLVRIQRVHGVSQVLNMVNHYYAVFHY